MQVALLRHGLKEKILGILGTQGCTISDVSRLLSIHPSTASKYLAVMDAEGSVSRRLIGMAKLYGKKSAKGE